MSLENWLGSHIKFTGTRLLLQKQEVLTYYRGVKDLVSKLVPVAKTCTRSFHWSVLSCSSIFINLLLTALSVFGIYWYVEPSAPQAASHGESGKFREAGFVPYISRFLKNLPFLGLVAGTYHDTERQCICERCATYAREYYQFQKMHVGYRWYAQRRTYKYTCCTT